MTNLEKIKQMSAQELAEMLVVETIEVDVDYDYDAASLRSLAPDADGVSDSRVRVQLPSDRRANKFDRGFPSVDDF